MNATNFGTNKDFRKTVDIRQKVRHGKIERKIYLPPEDFAYGLPNRPPTPFKDVIYNAYGNRAEDITRNEYGNYIRERSVKNSRPPEVITRYINPKAEEYKMRDLERKTGGLTAYNEIEKQENEKPLYKLKMFQDVGSKVAEEVKLFKTYHPYKKKKKIDDGVDYLINKVQGEIDQNNKLNNVCQPNRQSLYNQPIQIKIIILIHMNLAKIKMKFKLNLNLYHNKKKNDYRIEKNYILFGIFDWVSYYFNKIIYLL